LPCFVIASPCAFYLCSPPPWSVENIGAALVVKDSSGTETSGRLESAAKSAAQAMRQQRNDEQH
jgi:hypothetical protein